MTDAGYDPYNSLDQFTRLAALELVFAEMMEEIDHDTV